MFADARGGRPHEALDIAAPRGTPVHAVDDGNVAKLFTSVPGGLTVYQFDPSGRIAYYYAHLDRYADGLKEGAALRRCDVIGYVGSTGNASAEAPHLHFAVFGLGLERRWWEGVAINPHPALVAGGVAPAADRSGGRSGLAPRVERLRRRQRVGPAGGEARLGRRRLHRPRAGPPLDHQLVPLRPHRLEVAHLDVAIWSDRSWGASHGREAARAVASAPPPRVRRLVVDQRHRDRRRRRGARRHARSDAQPTNTPPDGCRSSPVK